MAAYLLVRVAQLGLAAHLQRIARPNFSPNRRIVIAPSPRPPLKGSDVLAATFGPGNPHPLSVLRTELVWEGKYDEFGNRREVDAAGLAMPFQRIETVDEPRARTEAQGGLFDVQKAHLDDFRNMLIWGDNKLIMASLLAEFRGKIDLIYIDPPFDVGADFTMNVAIGDGKDTVDKDQSTLEMVAYRDMWGRGTDSYLHMMFERLCLMRELLTDSGTIYVQCDWRMTAGLRLLLDEIFGRDRFLCEIAWLRSSSTGSSKAMSNKFPSNHDTILAATKSSEYTYHRQFKPYTEEYLKRFKHDDGDGRGLYRIDNLNTYSKEMLEHLKSENRLMYPKSAGANYSYKRYLNETEGIVIDDVWTDINFVNPMAKENHGYATQKPEALLERIITASSNEGDLVGDFFCGSGTSGAVAERLGRRWIMADLGRFAIHTSRKRLIDVQRDLHEGGKAYRAFDVFNLGRYERQSWQKERLKGADEDHRRVVLEFYKAEPLARSPSPYLHGRKGQALCHVDGIDSVFTRDEARMVARAAKDAGANDLTCLAWEFEMDLRMMCDALEREWGLHIKLIQIPREIMEKNRKEPPPFLEVATLEAEPVFRTVEGKRVVDIRLNRFIPSLAEVPTKELEAIQERAVSSGFDFIDFWAVDFDYRNDGPFHHHWQDYRTKKDRSLKTVSEQRYFYRSKGVFTACVKVVDIFGCDTSISVRVDNA